MFGHIYKIKLNIEDIMKTKQIILSIALVITATACDKKAEVSDKATVETQNVQQPAAPATKVPQKSQESSHPVSNEVSATKKNTDDGKGGENKSAAIGAETTEQVLDGVIPHGQQPVNSRVSEQKQHGKNAEDEMMTDIAQRK